jgi:hypothetical protein
MVVWFVLVFAVVNLALGYGAALALVEPPLWSGFEHLWQRRLKETEAENQAAVGDEMVKGRDSGLVASDLLDASGGAPIVAGYDELPPDWLAQIAVEGIVAQSFVEATAHVVRLEVNRYREQLVAAECRGRSFAADGNLCNFIDPRLTRKDRASALSRGSLTLELGESDGRFRLIVDYNGRAGRMPERNDRIGSNFKARRRHDRPNSARQRYRLLGSGLRYHGDQDEDRQEGAEHVTLPMAMQSPLEIDAYAPNHSVVPEPASIA